MKRSRGPLRKRPHILPPLAASVQATMKDPVDPLLPPNVVGMEPRFGSPTPRWHRPSAEESESLQENSDDGKPSIRVTFYDHEGNFPEGNNKKNSLDYDLRNDPNFAQEDTVFKEQRRDSLKNFLRDDKVDRLFNDRSTKRYACNLRNFNFDPLRSTGTTHGTEEIQPLKPMQLPNRYTLLKPICKRSTETNNQD